MLWNGIFLKSLGGGIKEVIYLKDFNIMLIGCVKWVRLLKILVYDSILIEKFVFN